MLGSSDALTRAEIAEAIHCEIGCSRVEALRMVEAILFSMKTAICYGQNVKISGFGSFVLNHKSERIGRNPRTGKEAQITARRVVTFRSSQGLKNRVA